MFFVLSLGASKKFNGPRINGWECPLLRNFGVVLEHPKGRTTRGRNWNTLKYDFFKGLCPIVVLSLGASGSSLNLPRTGRILFLGACLRSASLQEPRLKHFTEACGWKLATPSLRQRGGSCLGYCSCSCFGHLAASAFGGCFGHKYATAASTKACIVICIYIYIHPMQASRLLRCDAGHKQHPSPTHSAAAQP